MKFKALNEITSAGSIAANPSSDSRRDLRHGEREWRDHARPERKDANTSAHTQAQLARAKAIKAQREKRGFKDHVSRLFRRPLGEATSMDVSSVMSRLKGLENKFTPDHRSTVTYGVEDEKGNLMKITVKSEQASSFEQTLAMALGELEDNKINDQNASVSLAELLYNLKNQFDIIDVEFPEIPSQAVYNADKATYGMSDSDMPVADSTADTAMNGMDAQISDPSVDSMSDVTDMDDVNGMDSNDVEASDELDGDMGEDFPEDEVPPPSEESIYQGIIKMFTAQADAEKAKAEAEAEKARALQAEYSAKSASFEMTKQEELAAMEADLEMQKKRNKESRRMAALAKYRVQNSSGRSATSDQFEGVSSFLGLALGRSQEVIQEDIGTDTLESVPMLQRELGAIRKKWQVSQNDSPETQRYKQMMLQLDSNIINQRIKKARATLAFNQKTTNNQNPNQARIEQSNQSGEDNVIGNA